MSQITSLDIYSCSGLYSGIIKGIGDHGEAKACLNLDKGDNVCIYMCVCCLFTHAVSLEDLFKVEMYWGEIVFGVCACVVVLQIFSISISTVQYKMCFLSFHCGAQRCYS